MLYSIIKPVKLAVSQAFSISLQLYYFPPGVGTFP